MTNKIICSNQEISEDFSLNILFNVPLGLLDPNHPAINQNLQKKFFTTVIIKN